MNTRILKTAKQNLLTFKACAFFRNNCLAAALSLLVIFLLVGCKKDDAGPKPVAAFHTDFDNYTIEEPIKLINNSQGAVRYRWELGNGFISDLENPPIKFTSLGDYTIKLTAYNASGQSTTVSKKIRVSLREQVAVAIDDLNFSIQWDPVDGPDLGLKVTEGQGNDPTYFLTMHEDFTPSMVPMLYKIVNPLRVNAYEYTFELVDIDRNSEQTIIQTQVYPDSFTLKRDKETGYYYHTAQNSNATITIFYANR